MLADADVPDNMGMVIVAAQFATAGRLQEVSRLAKGIMYLALTDERSGQLGLELIPPRDASLTYAPVTPSIAARVGITTGISLAEHAHTIHVAIDPTSTSGDIRLGGHVHPLRARPLGVLERAGLTEATADLARLAHLLPAGVLGEIRLDDGTVAQGHKLLHHARLNGLPVVTIDDVIAYRRHHDRLVERVVETSLPTISGEFSAVGYRGVLDDRANLALVRGEIAAGEDVLAYLHFGCWAGDVFRGSICRCREALDAAVSAVRSAGRGAIVHMADPAPDRHLRTGNEFEPDVWLGAQILADLGVSSVRLLFSPERPAPDLEGYGFAVAGHEPLNGN
jgi:3,4-dihydroxy 2-butanone 4-phosphate synthase / GTP cyclohydrolase II